MTYEEYLDRIEVFDYFDMLSDSGVNYAIDNNVSSPGVVIVKHDAELYTIRAYFHDGKMIDKIKIRKTK